MPKNIHMNYKLSVMSLVLVIATGCVAHEELKASTESILLTESEIQQLLIGNTFPFSKGGMYFSSETEATVHWDGKNEDTEWYVNEAGEFCYTVELFGGNEECLGLEKLPSGDYLRKFEGKTTPVKATDIKAGKTF